MTTRPPRKPKAGPEPPRVVLDTNVVLSALVFSKDSTARLRAAWQRGDFVPLVSTATAHELVRVLAYPEFRLDAAARQELLADYLPHTLVAAIPGPPPARSRLPGRLRPAVSVSGRRRPGRCAGQRRCGLARAGWSAALFHPPAQ